ncbi:MAG: prepilin-type N-terminal cleavage/methylation domain-containing protein [Nitrospinota bacterium]|nr:prepilin-type N-terminal cleavage/methylation domain-containing protein [Nitrospinota bacterium]
MKIDNKGFTLIELLTVMAIIGVLTTIAIPAFAQYKARALDADAKSHLHSLYIACKSYWTDTGSANDCTMPIISTAAYGYKQIPTISITLSGNEMTFIAIASHVDSANSFTMDSFGNIS